MTAAPTPTADRASRLEQLYEISKLFTAFDGVEHSVDAALKVVADKLPVESAILIETALGGRTGMIVWSSAGSEPARLRAAKAHALDAYAYMIGDRSDTGVAPSENVGRTLLPAPIRDAASAGGPTRFIMLPLIVGRRGVFGALQLEGATAFDLADLSFVNTVVNQLAIALDRNRAWGHDVVRRREAQAAHAKYEALVDSLDYAFVWEAELATRRVSYTSAQFEDIIGVTRHECFSQPDWWLANAHPDDRAQLRATFERALAEPGSHRCDHRCVNPDGRVRWLHTSVHVAGGGLEPLHFQGVSFDVTSARAAQDAVAEQLALTSALANSLGEGTLAIDLDERITFVNDEGKRMLGCTTDDAVGKRVAEVKRIETTTGEMVAGPIELALHSGERVRSDEHFIVRRDGTRFAASYTASPIHRDHVVTGAVLAFEDISARRYAHIAERFLLAASVTLSASLDSTAVEKSVAQLGVPMLGEICIVKLISSDVGLVAVASAHVDSTAQLQLDAMVAPGAGLFARAGDAVVASGRSVRLPELPGAWPADVDPASLEQLHVRRALIVPLVLGARTLGTLTFCMTGQREYRDADVALAEELARRSAFAIEHARLYQQARRAIEMREQTLAIVSHDLRSPLNTIMLASTIVLEDELIPHGPSAPRAAVEKIQTAAGRMERMIGDLLDFASIEAGQLAINVSPRSIAAIVIESTSGFEAIATKRGIHLTAETAINLPLVECDRDRLLQVLGNLLGNALKAARSGDSVRLRASLVAGSALFVVSDTGPGISSADQRRLFERYWRSPDATYQGVGLGLAIARGIVDAHGGRMWVDSVLGEGATFSFTLPLVRAPAVTAS